MTGLRSLNSLVAVALSADRSYSWNGPVCAMCGRGYVGEHECAPADLRAQIGWRQAKLDEIEAAAP